MTREVDPAVKALREQMAIIAARRESAGLVVDFARYDKETSAPNQELVSSFLGALPVRSLYSDGSSIVHGVACGVEDPADLRTLTTFGVNCRVGDGSTDDIYTGFVIGERLKEDDKPSRKEVLVAGWKRGKWISDNTFEDPEPCVYRVDVPTKPWDELREQGLNRLPSPHRAELLKSLFHPDTSLYVIRPEDAAIAELTTVTNVRMWAGASRISHRVKVRNRTDVDEHQVASFDTRIVPLLSSDIEEFGVMAHLETLAAAFGIGPQLDEIKDTYTKSLPTHPADSILGLEDYREVTETAAIHELGSTAAAQRLS